MFTFLFTVFGLPVELSTCYNAFEVAKSPNFVSLSLVDKFLAIFVFFKRKASIFCLKIHFALC